MGIEDLSDEQLRVIRKAMKTLGRISQILGEEIKIDFERTMEKIRVGEKPCPYQLRNESGQTWCLEAHMKEVFDDAERVLDIGGFAPRSVQECPYLGEERIVPIMMDTSRIKDNQRRIMEIGNPEIVDTHAIMELQYACSYVPREKEQ